MPSHNFQRIKNEPNLRKDASSGAVLNVSSEEYNKYLKRKQTIQNQNSRLENLEAELHEVKSLLRAVVENLSNDAHS